MTLKLFMILWTAECCCEDIDENDQDHHDANADVYTEKEQSSNFFQKDCIDLLFGSVKEPKESQCVSVCPSVRYKVV